MKTKYYGVTEQDIEEIKARWWCYDGNGGGGSSKEETNTKSNTIST